MSIRVGLGFLVGAAAALVARRLDIPGDGSWIVLFWVAGIVAAAIRASASTLVASFLGIALSTILLVLAGGQYPGLAWLVVTVEAAVLAHGFLVAATVRRAIRRRTLADRRVIVGIAAAVLLAGCYVLVALDFARNPP